MSEQTRELQRLLTENRRKTIADLPGVNIARVVTVHTESIDVQPVVPKIVNGEIVQPPVFRNVPPIFIYGGSSYEAMPISVGDYCLLIVCESSFDRWYAGQDGGRPLENRRHDYSDCFAIVGVRPLASAIPIPTIDTRRGDCDIEGDYTHTGLYTHDGILRRTGNKEQTGDTTIIGNVGITGGLTMNNTTGTASTTNGDINHTGNIDITGTLSYDDIESDGQTGVSGSFTSQSGGTVTVTNGIITSIS